MISRVCPGTPVLFLDTGFHFQETLAFRDRLAVELGLTIRILSPLMGHEQWREKHGELWATNPGMCCYMNKVEPLQRALETFDAWITGIRRDQTSQRRAVTRLSMESGRRVKICPLAGWSAAMIERYIDHYALPRHPLHDQGYRSIGCHPCTAPVSSDAEDRSGRWEGQDKTECGIHFVDAGTPAGGKRVVRTRSKR